MDRTIQVIWWIGLLGALAATVAVLKQVSLLLRTLRHILELAEMTRDAARGVAGNLEAISRLAEVEAPARGLRESTGALVAAATTLERRLDGLASAAGSSPTRRRRRTEDTA